MYECCHIMKAQYSIEWGVTSKVTKATFMLWRVWVIFFYFTFFRPCNLIYIWLTFLWTTFALVQKGFDFLNFDHVEIENPFATNSFFHKDWSISWQYKHTITPKIKYLIRKNYRPLYTKYMKVFIYNWIYLGFLLNLKTSPNKEQGEYIEKNCIAGRLGPDSVLPIATDKLLRRFI